MINRRFTWIRAEVEHDFFEFKNHQKFFNISRIALIVFLGMMITVENGKMAERWNFGGLVK